MENITGRGKCRPSRAKYPVNSGVGSSINGGRWNPPGISAIYFAENRALAALEILVHYSVLPRDFVIVRIDFDSRLVSAVDQLPADGESDVSLTMKIGSAWHHGPRSALLRVPSSIDAKESNYVLNPDHPDFPMVAFGVPVPYRFDPRLRG